VGQIALVLSGCGIAFVLIEIGLRLFGISYPYFYIPDELTGFSLKPGAQGLWQKEGKVSITINSAGLRDREHSLEKPPGTFRIAVLGDSYTEAMQLPMEQTYWARMEQELSGCSALAGRQVEVVNFGVSGYSTAQELLVLRHKVQPYHPDLVLQALFTGNDITGNSRELDANNIRPYFLMKDGRLVLDDSFRRSMAFWLQQLPFSSEAFEVSRVLQVFREARYKLQAYLNEVEQQQRMKDRIGPEIDLDATVYLEPTDPVWQKAWKITEELVLLIKREAEEQGSRYLLVSLSNSDQVHPNLQHRQTMARQLGMPDLFYPDRRIQALAKREGIELLSLAEPLAAYAEEHGVFLHGFQNSQMGQGHWNASAHRLAGHLMSERICAMLVFHKAVVPERSSYSRARIFLSHDRKTLSGREEEWAGREADRHFMWPWV
jgi:lysophospholipase L1-like esterase